MLLASRYQCLHLLPSRNHSPVRSIELCEFGYKAICRVERVRLVQHEIAKERVQIAQIFRRLGLVQKLKSQFVVDTETSAESLRIGSEIFAGESLRELHLQSPYVKLKVA